MVAAYLVVGNQHHALREVKLYPATRRGLNLPRHRLVAADSNRRRAPDVCHDSRRYGKGPLRHSHVGVEPLAVDKIQRGSNDLGKMDAVNCKGQLRYS